ncbi:MAG: hypothetical protein BYD32DRAFT_410711 [Podila humilis]|nr:MAG: hypothetical protein BYD32DRAFT_410711 [Podila humilis]
MARESNLAIPILDQKFVDKDNNPIGELPTIIDPTIQCRYIQWKTIEKTFRDIEYLTDHLGERTGVAFLRRGGEREVVFSNQPYMVILKKHSLLDGTKVSPSFEPRKTLHPIPQKNSVPEKHGFRSWIKNTFTGKESTTKSDAESVTTISVNTDIPSISNKSLHGLTETFQGHTSSRSSLVSLHGFDLQQQPLSDCQDILDSTNHCLGNHAPHLFLVLPADLGPWDGMDPTIQNFRLYFMCDSRSFLSSSIQPKHIHLSGHQGYDLIRSNEFFQLYGEYTLTLLEMVKHGFSTGAYRVPSLDSFDILRNCRGDPVHHQITESNIESLVCQAIAYIQKLSPLPRPRRLLDSRETNHIRTFIKLEEDDNGLGGLYRTVYSVSGSPLRWLCTVHSLEYHETRSLEKYVSTRQGTFNQQLSTIDIPLTSTFQATTFAQELKNSHRVFGITLRLTWNVSVAEFQGILRTISRSGAVTVQIDGINPDTCQRLFNPLETDFGDVQLVTLLNYPRPFEHHIYLRNIDGFVHCLHLSSIGECDWQDALRVLESSREFLANWREHPARMDTILHDLSVASSSLDALDLKGIGFLDRRTKETQGWLRVQDGAVLGVTEATLPNDAFPESLLECGTMLRLRIQTPHSAYVRDLRRLFGLNLKLGCLEFPVQDGSIFRYLDPVLRMMPKGPAKLQVDLFENRENDEMRVARLVIEAMDTKGSAYPAVTDILEWKCSHVTGIEGVGGATVLDMATLRFPSVLVSLSLDITALTEQGLICVRNIFLRSSLEQLRVRCTKFGPVLYKHLGMALGAIPWLTITSFALHSADIDTWFYLWAKVEDISTSTNLFRLLNFELFGAGAAAPPLSHATILSIHNLIYSAPLLQLGLESIYLPQEQDWGLIIGVINFSRLLHLSLVDSNVGAMKPWISLLREQLPELDLVYFASLPGEKRLTFVSYTRSAPEGSAANDVHASQGSFRSMSIEGISILDQENDLQHGLFPGFIDCYVESATPNSKSRSSILKAGALHQAIVSSTPDRSVPRPYKVHPVREPNPGMQELELPTNENDIPRRISQLRQYWSGRSGQLHAELVPEGGGPVKAVVTIGKQQASLSDSLDSEASIKFLRWAVCCVSAPLRDGDATVLDMATSRYPLVLAHFSLDITFLTDRGMASVRNVLERSRLKNVHVNCGPIQSEVRESLCLLLESMNESSITSLVLEGNNVDGWLRLWGTIEKLPRWRLDTFALTAKERWQALDGSNLRLIQHLIQLENPPQIQMSGCVCTEWRDWDIFRTAAGKGRKLRLRVPWAAATTITERL